MNEIWQWAAYGKHPVAKDFFKLGHQGSLGTGFSEWVDQGYRLMASRKKIAFYSWRFWAKGPKSDWLGCGVVRDCHDQLTRPYPLLLMGTGPLSGWEEYWDLVPLATERTWAQMEYLFTKTFANLKQLEEEVQKILPPLAQWSELQEIREQATEWPRTSHNREIEGSLFPLFQKTEVFVPLDQGFFSDPFTGINLLHYLFKKERKNIPQAIFMGGTLEKTLLAIFQRPLLPSDFVQLWSTSCSGGL